MLNQFVRLENSESYNTQYKQATLPNSLTIQNKSEPAKHFESDIRS